MELYLYSPYGVCRNYALLFTSSYSFRYRRYTIMQTKVGIMSFETHRIVRGIHEVNGNVSYLGVRVYRRKSVRLQYVGCVKDRI
jgi:hypothetical protein